MKLQIHPKAEGTWQKIGRHTTALVVDDFLANAEEVRRFALELEYDLPKEGDHYPGVQSTVSLPGAADVVRWVAERYLQKIFGEGRPPFLTTADLRSPCTFCAMSCNPSEPPGNLLDQHVDNRHWLATLLHLSPSSEGRGTAFWRHKKSGLEHWIDTGPLGASLPQVRVLEELLGMRLSSELDGMSAGQMVFGSLGQHGFFTRSPSSKRRPFTRQEDDDWQLLDFVPARFNRLVVYPTWQIHSGVDEVEGDRYDTSTMRLTLNQWVGYPIGRAFNPLDKLTYPSSFYRPVTGLNVTALAGK